MQFSLDKKVKNLLVLSDIVKGFTMINKDNNKQPIAVSHQEGLQKLIENLSHQGYHVIGPTVSDNAIVFDEIAAISDLPIGLTDQQDGGSYRLVNGDGKSLFGYVVGPQSWKKYLYPAVQKLWEAKASKGSFEIIGDSEEPPKQVFLGVRSCDLQAIQILDKVLAEGPYADPMYIKRRQNSIIIAVNCVKPNGTCFCSSMGTGPRAQSGFDLALTELIRGEKHDIIIECGSKIGAEQLQKIPHKNADDELVSAVDAALKQAAERMGRQLDSRNVQSLLARNFEHPHWDMVARRCLTCGNCTMVCPTCFCSTVEDTTDLTGGTASRTRKWDSCFTMDFSYIFGGSIRQSSMSRYRQWMTHKLSTWVNQFGMLGCVGCGRCITWCPVGIDITEEARFFKDSELAGNTSTNKKDVSYGKS